MRAAVASNFHLVLVLCLSLGALVSAILSHLRHDSPLRVCLHAAVFFAAVPSVLYHPALTIALMSYLFPMGAQNALATWSRAALGPRDFDSFVREAVRKGGVVVPVISGLVWAGFWAAISAWLYFLSRPHDWAAYVAIGISCFAVTSAVGWVLHFGRIWWSLDATSAAAG